MAKKSSARQGTGKASRRPVKTSDVHSGESSVRSSESNNSPGARIPTEQERNVRIFLRSVDGEDDDIPGESKLTIDARLGEDNRIVGKWALLGFEGKLDSPNTIWPFILRSDGDVDFGYGPELLQRPEIAIRHWNFNIREKRIAVGELATFSNSEDKEPDTYRIHQIVELGKA